MTLTESRPAGSPPSGGAPPPDLGDAALAAVSQELAVTAERYDRSGEFPWDGIHAVHRAGLLRLGIGPAHGGSEVSTTDLVRVFLALGAGDPSVALLTAMTTFQHVLQARRPWWPEAVYRDVVAASATRPQLLNAIRAEPEWGAPARGGLPATTVRRTAAGWVLDGRKGFATGCEGLRHHLVWAVDHSGDEPALAHAVVPADSPGIRIERTWDHLGMRATGSHDVVYTGVEIADDHFRGVPASASAAALADFAGPGLALTALYVGVARSAQAFFVRFAQERVPTSLGRPIATTERIQTVAGEIEADLVLAEELLFGLAGRLDAGDPRAPERALLAKLIGTRSAIAAVQAAVAALGNPALSRAHPLERHLRDVLASRVHPPQDDAALLGAGRRTLAVSP